jgi:hypothetical protein
MSSVSQTTVGYCRANTTIFGSYARLYGSWQLTSAGQIIGVIEHFEGCHNFRTGRA